MLDIFYESSITLDFLDYRVYRVKIVYTCYAIFHLPGKYNFVSEAALVIRIIKVCNLFLINYALFKVITKQQQLFFEAILLYTFCKCLSHDFKISIHLFPCNLNWFHHLCCLLIHLLYYNRYIFYLVIFDTWRVLIREELLKRIFFYACGRHRRVIR